MENQERFIQVGVTALRNHETGEFMPAVPLYIKADDSAIAAEEKLTIDLGKLFAARMKQYQAGCRAAGLQV